MGGGTRLVFGILINKEKFNKIINDWLLQHPSYTVDDILYHQYVLPIYMDCLTECHYIGLVFDEFEPIKISEIPNHTKTLVDKAKKEFDLIIDINEINIYGIELE